VPTGREKVFTASPVSSADFYTLEKSSFHRDDHPPYASPAPWGAGAHCDASELPVQKNFMYCTKVIRRYHNGGCLTVGGEAPESVRD
jgi:hypothetical protein